METKTKKVKKLVLKFLSDAESHELLDIKKYVLEHIDEPITHNIFYSAVDGLLRKGDIIKVKKCCYCIGKLYAYTESGDVFDKLNTLTNQYKMIAGMILNTCNDDMNNLQDKIDKICQEVCDILS